MGLFGRHGGGKHRIPRTTWGFLKEKWLEKFHEKRGRHGLFFFDLVKHYTLAPVQFWMDFREAQYKAKVAREHDVFHNRDYNAQKFVRSIGDVPHHDYSKSSEMTNVYNLIHNLEHHPEQLKKEIAGEQLEGLEKRLDTEDRKFFLGYVQSESNLAGKQGELLHAHADNLASGGKDAGKREVFNHLLHEYEKLLAEHNRFIQGRNVEGIVIKALREAGVMRKLMYKKRPHPA